MAIHVMHHHYIRRRSYSGIPRMRKPKPSGPVTRTATTFGLRRGGRGLPRVSYTSAVSPRGSRYFKPGSGPTAAQLRRGRRRRYVPSPTYDS